ncbi:aldo/keto reductase [Cellulomonas soli]|uniref:aldo/keto reductase n=1 Tax=Cellulomonas soli TaxID=931535 RepID=UPI003F82AFA7
MTVDARDLVLNNGVTIPQLGYGVFRVPADQVQAQVEHAVASGYRHVDTAQAYGNEEGVGAAIRAVGRERVFVTTKLWNSDQGYEQALRTFEESRRRLGVDQIDLYLIHFPAPQRMLWAETWRAFEKLYADGAVRAIGVSNFKFPYLNRLLQVAEVVPAVHQIEVHPTYQQAELDALSRAHGLVVEAYSPLGQGTDLTSPAVTGIAAAHGVEPAHVILAWHLQRGRVALPTSQKPARIASNIRVGDLMLTADELTAIDGLEAGLRTGEDIETFN